jgi:hypothetical protein
VEITGRHRAFPVASGELTDAEIAMRYGATIESAFANFRSDPSYLIDMAAQGSQIARRRSQALARANAREQAKAKKKTKPRRRT